MRLRIFVKPQYWALCFFAALLAFWPLSTVRADQPFQRFEPLLIDLNGWKGKKPEGMSMQMSDASMTSATREYERGSGQLHASVLVGQAAVGALPQVESGMNISTSEGHAISTTINGMPVLKSYNIADKSGMLIVALSKSAVFSLGYENISEDEALALAEKFDWKALQQMAAQIK
ncbi:hypothetical protein AC629_05285 [Bradyrhizobium sp. NAS80.1]|uniref:hypothetical protein n=1 Tax=Bradyrhizobium sp. NAS80.1 TaxID=1680159 RepID=UPI0009601D92|nr:hypothetical protein [Bradyrhizobium sp. NAS80.1]OKO90086.1 hypothetical protein AC629_05285 [Bradyrhizobium sp. NAS80.1]